MELKDTLTMMLSDDYRERFKAEYHQLLARMAKLSDVINGYYAGTLDFQPSVPVLLLEKQFKAMDEYFAILLIRAEIEGIQVDIEPPEEERPYEEVRENLPLPEEVSVG